VKKEIMDGIREEDAKQLYAEAEVEKLRSVQMMAEVEKRELGFLEQEVGI
jgi:hypothetical protein